MDIVPNDLLAAAAEARSRLAVASHAIARSATDARASASPVSMAAAARDAIFADALLAAVHGRFEALKNVSK
jgi:hypothetical protein